MVEIKKILHNKIYYYEQLDSTNLKALELAKQGAAEGTIVIAARQTAGRGRMRRKWESPEGKGLWFSMILRPTIAAEYCAQITLLTAVAAVKALQVLTDKKFSIKWPNDIMLDGKKVCGILAEMALTADGSIEYAVVGIGININMSSEDFGAQLEATATSLYLATGIEYEHEQVLKIYDEEVRPQQTDDFRDMANAISLLWRLNQTGVDVGSRWADMAEIALRRRHDTTLVFASLHTLAALVAMINSAPLFAPVHPEDNRPEGQ